MTDSSPLRVSYADAAMTEFVAAARKGGATEVASHRAEWHYEELPPVDGWRCWNPDHPTRLVLTLTAKYPDAGDREVV